MIWHKKEVSAGLISDIAEKYGCDKLTASILARRNVTSGGDILYVLEDDTRYFHNPFALSGMEDAVEKILAVQEDGGKILVFGDRDADGVTSTAMLVRALTEAGADVAWRLPMGEEAYGLSLAAVEEFARDYGSLIITVDCGVSNYNEIARAAELGVEVIVTDHHEARAPLPPAFAVINPKLKDERGEYGYPFQYLAGCAVVYKLIQALDFARKSSLFNQQVCLLNTRPGNGGTWVVELKKYRNLVLTGFLTETFITDSGEKTAIGSTRLPAFLEGQHIYTWDAPERKKNLALIFGAGVEFSMYDIAPDAARVIPSTAEKGLPRLKEMSRLGRYDEQVPDELDVLFSVFKALFQKAEGIFACEGDVYLQLAALGTLADLVPLENENRLLVRRGLAAINAAAVSGLSDLIFKLNLSAGALSTTDISWRVTPVLNAAGRMGDAAVSVELLLEDDRARREELATRIIALNEQRRKLTDAAMLIARAAAEKNMDDYAGNLAFAASGEIARGVTGLAANRLCTYFSVPAIVVSISGETATGSIRSARGYNVQALLDATSRFFIDCGGHDFAAGFSMDMANWDAFTACLKEIAFSLEFPDEAEGAALNIDAELPLSYLKPDILSLVDKFQPYGRGNEELLFLARRLGICDISFTGKQEAKHVKLLLDAQTYKWPAMYWSAAEKVNVEWTKGDTVDAVFRITRNYFAGNITPTLIISDMRRSESARSESARSESARSESAV
ncbi:MAG: single-stranded-DNA-specific exonuclease RecJ [Spirochaetaceae bacterium]|jgi:single-stranded-DNA-specific exonuclease|nr:single-stranded-DNA-specific exonuclease RecJ [Spirochaetaceae bacterium]